MAHEAVLCGGGILEQSGKTPEMNQLSMDAAKGIGVDRRPMTA